MEKSRYASAPPEKRCFVTVGATAPFNALVRAVLATDFISALKAANYTQLRIQYGDNSGRMTFEEHQVAYLESEETARDDILIDGFDFKKEGLQQELIAVKGSSMAGEGLVISHAGSGSVLDALRIGVPIIVVPNTDLLHNHQVELAEALAEQEYVIHGQVNDLSTALGDAEMLRTKSRNWPPLRSGEEKYSRGLQDVIYEEMGWQIG